MLTSSLLWAWLIFTWEEFWTYWVLLLLMQEFSDSTWLFSTFKCELGTVAIEWCPCVSEESVWWCEGETSEFE